MNIAQRFRGFLPIVLDVETAGFEAEEHALLEIAAVAVDFNAHHKLVPVSSFSAHVLPFEGASLDPEALEFTGITDPFHPFRFAVEEKNAMKALFEWTRQLLKQHHCSKAVLTGHNPAFDLSFIKAAAERTACWTHSPFHRFTTFDTATLAGLAYGQTVLARACHAAHIPFSADEAHSAIYDANKTCELFCKIVNRSSLR